MEKSACAAASSIASPPGISHSVPCHRNFFACRRRRQRWIQSSFRTRSPLAAFAAAAAASASDDSEVPPAKLEDEEDPVLPTVSTTFLLEKRCEYGERFVVAGDHEFLGAWDPSSAIAMTWSEGHVWKCEVDLPVGKLYEFKFVLTSKEAEPHWQPGPNRSFTTSKEAPVIVSDAWEPEEVDEGSTQFRSESPDDVPTTGPDVDGAELGGEGNLEEAALHSEVSQAVADVTTQVEENVPAVVANIATEVENSEPAITSTETVTRAEPAIDSTVPDLTSEEEPEEEEPNDPPEAAASVPSKQTISEDTSSTVQADQDTAPAETSELSVQGGTSSPAVKEDSKGFKSFKFDTPDRSASPTENTSKNGQSVTTEATEVPFLEAALASTVLSGDEEVT